MQANGPARTRRRLLALGGGLAALSYLPGCGRLLAEPVRIAAHPWPGYELMFLAAQEKLFDPDQAALISTAQASESLEQLARGEVDGAALTLDEVLRARARGIDLSVVLVFDESAGADALMARPSIRAVSELVGQRVGVERSALGEYMLHLTLASAGLGPEDVQVVPFGADGHLSAWRSGGIDALVTYEPVVSQLENAGARRLFDSRKLPGAILDVLAMRRPALARRASASAAVVQAHFLALHHLRANPQDAAYRMAGRLGLPASEVLKSFRSLILPDLEANRRLLAPGGGVFSSAAQLSRVMVKAGLLSRDDSLVDIADAGCLPEKI